MTHGFGIAVTIAAMLSAEPKVRQPDVKVDNAVEACVAVEPRRVYEQANLLLFAAGLSSKKSTAECGCKSGVIAYRVTEKTRKMDRQTMLGHILSTTLSQAATEFLFVLRPDKKIGIRGTFSLHLGCEDS